MNSESSPSVLLQAAEQQPKPNTEAAHLMAPVGNGVGGSPMRLALFRNIVKAVTEEFCRINGLSIKEQAVNPATEQEPKC